jgi:hypothetical protein
METRYGMMVMMWGKERTSPGVSMRIEWGKMVLEEQPVSSQNASGAGSGDGRMTAYQYL